MSGRLKACGVVLALSVVGGCGSADPTLAGGASGTSVSATDRTTTAPVRDSAPDPFDEEAVHQALVNDWGLENIRVVPVALRGVMGRYPQNDGGSVYDPDTLTVTQYVVDDAGRAPKVRAELRAAFEQVAGDSNITLQLVSAPRSRFKGAELQQQLMQAGVEDPQWPKDLELTGGWDPASGTYLIDAGEMHDDPDANTYFDREWGGLVVLSDAQPNVPEPGGANADRP